MQKGYKYTFEVKTTSTYKDFNGLIQYNIMNLDMYSGVTKLGIDDGLSSDTSVEGTTTITLVAQETGELKLGVSGFAGFSSDEIEGFSRIDTPYTLTTQNLGQVDIYANSKTKAHSISLADDGSGMLFGTITDASIYDAQKDFDWFTFDGVNGKSYSITAKYATGEEKKITLEGEGAVHYGQDDFTQAQKYYSPAVDGSVDFSVSGTVGEYTLEIQEIVIDAHGDTSYTATELTLGAEAINGNILAWSDKDYFQIATEEDKLYEVTLTSTNLDSYKKNNDYFLHVNDTKVKNSNLWWEDEHSYLTEYDDKKVMTFQAQTTGTEFFSIDSFFATGDYTVSVIEKVDDIANDTSSTQTLAIDTVANANIYNVKYALPSSNYGFKDADGNVIKYPKAYNPDGNRVYSNFDPEVVYVDENGVTLYIFSEESENDNDFFKISVEENKTYLITVEGSHFSPKVYVTDSNGTKKSESTDSNWVKQDTGKYLTKLIYLADADADDYFLQVIGLIGSEDYTVKYEEFQISDDSMGGDSIETAEEVDISLGKQVIQSTIDITDSTVGDFDYYKFNVEAGKQYVIKNVQVDKSMNDLDYAILHEDGTSNVETDYGLINGSSKISGYFDKMLTYLLNPSVTVDYYMTIDIAGATSANVYDVAEFMANYTMDDHLALYNNTSRTTEEDTLLERYDTLMGMMASSDFTIVEVYASAGYSSTINGLLYNFKDFKDQYLADDTRDNLVDRYEDHLGADGYDPTYTFTATKDETLYLELEPNVASDSNGPYSAGGETYSSYTYKYIIEEKGSDQIGDTYASAVDFAQADLSFKDGDDTRTGELRDYAEFSSSDEEDGILKGSLEKNGDKDVYKIDLEAGQQYEFFVNNVRVDLKFYDLNGERVTQNSNWGEEGDGSLKSESVHQNGVLQGTKKIFIVPTTATYYIEAAENSNFGNYTGEYEISVVNVSQDDDFGSSSKTAGGFNAYVQTLTDSNSVEYEALKGTIDYSRDADWIKLDTISGNDYKIELDSTTMDKLKLRIFDKSGHEVFLKSSYILNNKDTGVQEQAGITIDWKTEKDAALTLSAIDSTYFVEVQSYREEGDYELTFNLDNTLDDYGSSFSTAGNFTYINANDDDATDSTISARIDKINDKDWFFINIEKDSVYEIVLDSAVITSNDFYVNWGTLVANKTKDASTLSTTDNHFIFTSHSDFGLIEISDKYNVGDYSITLNKLASDTFDGDRDNAIDVALVESTYSEVESLLNQKDHDMKKVDLIAGKSYTIELLADTSNTTALGQLSLSIMDDARDNIEDGVVREWNPGDAMERLTFTPTTSGTYYLDIYSPKQGLGDYTLNINETDMSNDIGSTITDNTLFTDLDSDTNGIISDTIDTTFDRDWIKYSFEAGKQYQISVDSLNTTTGKVYIFDESGKLMKDNQIWDGDSHNLTNDDKTIIFTATETKEHIIVVADTAVTDYNLEITEYVESDDLAADNSGTTTITVGTPITSKITNDSDKDWIKVDFVAGNIYKIDASASTDTQALNANFSIGGIYDANGVFIEGTSNASGEVVFNAESSASYFIEVTGDSGSIGVFDLSVSSFSATEKVTALANNTTDQTLTVGTTYKSEVDYYYDKDWVKVVLKAGTIYDVSMIGDTLKNSVIGGIYDANGDIVADTYNDNGSNFTMDAKTTFTTSGTQGVDADITYFIEAEAFKDGTGSYSLDVAINDGTTSGDDETSSATDSNNLTSTAKVDNGLSKYIYGEINYDGDSDYFEYNFEAGVTYEISMYGSSSKSGTLSDTFIKSIKDSNGVAIDGMSDARSGNGTDSFLKFTATETAAYYVETSSQNSSMGSYRLKVKEQSNIDSDIEGVSGSHTMMIYLAGDNNLEGHALNDLIELQLAELPTDWNVTFLIDRIDGYSATHGDWTDTRQGIIEFVDVSDESIDPNEINSSMESLGELNTGDGQTLTNFINWSTMNAQADTYSLVIFDHGGGITGSAWDDTNGHDNLEINELTQSIENSILFSDKAETGDKAFELVSFDTCLQGIIDQQYALTSVTDTVVSSEEVSWTDYWNYSKWADGITEVFNANGGNITGAEMGKAMIDVLQEYDESGQNGKDMTFSVVETELLDELVVAVNDLNTSLATISSDDKNSVGFYVENVVSFGDGESIDIGAFAAMIDSLDITSGDGTVDTKAQAVTSAISTAVFANYSNMDGTGGTATGIAMYYHGGYETDNYMDNFELAGVMNMHDFYEVV